MSRLRALAFAALCLPLVAVRAVAMPAPEAAQPLALSDVLASVEAHYPLLRAAEAERGIAGGALRSAEGSFDTRLVAGGDLRPEGFYESYSGDALVEQPTQLWGARFFGGYRIGRGDFAAYDGGIQTKRDGEIRGGIELPLLRGGRTDASRARLAQGQIDRRLVEPGIDLQQIEFTRAASVAYWNWVAAGRNVEVARQLLEVAQRRQDQITGRVQRGALPAIDLVDNERLIIDRRIRLRGAERDAEQAAIGLSLFLRDPQGQPVIAAEEQLPLEFPAEPEPDRNTFETDLAHATEGHPLLRRFALERDRLEVDLELARNELLPALDLRVEGSRDFGSDKPGISSEGSISNGPRGDTEVKALLRLELPVQRRKASGRVLSAEARLSRLANRERFARERIGAEIRSAMANLEATYAQSAASRRNRDLALRLRDAEERKLTLGSSNLIDVNIRELQAADAAVDLIETQAAYQRAVADYRAAVATPL